MTPSLPEEQTNVLHTTSLVDQGSVVAHRVHTCISEAVEERRNSARAVGTYRYTRTPRFGLMQVRRIHERWPLTYTV